MCVSLVPTSSARASRHAPAADRPLSASRVACCTPLVARPLVSSCVVAAATGTGAPRLRGYRTRGYRSHAHMDALSRGAADTEIIRAAVPMLVPSGKSGVVLHIGSAMGLLPLLSMEAGANKVRRAP